MASIDKRLQPLVDVIVELVARDFLDEQRMNGAELKALRKSLNLSLAQAAKQVEVSVRTWARWETSETVPPGAVKLFKIQNGLDQPGTK